MILRSLSMAGLAAALLQASACSSAEAEGDKGKTPASATEKRDTSIVHEPCDTESSDAVKVDVKSNGHPSIIHVMKGGKEVCRAVDLNMDGAIDAFIYYDDQGRVRRREQDFDRDGRADEITIYENGQIKLKLRETNFDNKIDTWDYYENGRLVKRERDTDGDAIIDQWWQFNNPGNPKCAVVASDRNADGKPDPDSVVDLCGESYGAPKGAPATAPSASPRAPASAAPAAPAAPAAAPPPSAMPAAAPPPPVMTGVPAGAPSAAPAASPKQPSPKK
jgi:hypothetical protein